MDHPNYPRYGFYDYDYDRREAEALLLEAAEIEAEETGRRPQDIIAEWKREAEEARYYASL